ncbi:autophagy-related 7 [Anticarsia gemmatalis]|uniref:autophagy-related 7 n=1 Tax=Anticarsia gemmatalis TaxID=129554 RepID=UPI003F75EB1B
MSASEDQVEIIQYVPFMSFVHPSFWHSLTEMKLNVDKLNETSKQVFGRYTPRDDIGAVFEVDGTSFNKVPEVEQLYTNVKGTIINKNTIEEFKSIDKASLLNTIGKTIWENLKEKNWINNPSSLLNFFIFSFADLKKYHYYYWFAFPAPSQPVVHVTEKSANITNALSNKQLEDLAQGYKLLENAQKCFFALTINNDSLTVNTLSNVLPGVANMNKNNLYFVFQDPSNGSNPGWPLRVFIAALLDYCPSLSGSDIKFIGLRCNVSGGVANSRIFSVRIPKEIQKTESAGWVGWERNDKGNFGPKLANMSASLDPVILADTSADLNIKLMKWRLVPDIDVDVMKQTKCLLLGAGTLGCHVARDLLAWGFRHITFVDNGKVSYSNPTRQVLFTHEDCLNGGRMKAEAAADNLRRILPSVVTKGIVAHIPMPGHPIGEALMEETITNIKVITEAIKEHDVIFLLLDTREARWLPTVLGTYYKKIVINAALGFDSYVVMRHGAHDTSSKAGSVFIDAKWVAGDNLGCYFCNDVTVPGNSLQDRTLDQQCTVTRPGVAAMAGALAAEVLVALLQHPLREHAPAPYNLSDETENIPDLEGVLGPVPHAIRGFLHSYQTILPTFPKFNQCIACSVIVYNNYMKEDIQFLLNVFNSGGKYLDDVTGLSQWRLHAEMSEVLTLTDDDEEN